MKEHRRIRLLASVAIPMLRSNQDACRAFVDHVDTCPICSITEDFEATTCTEIRLLYETYMTARMRTRLYFGGDDFTVLATECW